jgi:hypothetical protein
VKLASVTDNAYAIAVDANNIYFTTAGAGTIVQLPKSGGTPTPIATGLAPASGGGTECIAVDATTVYATVASLNGAIVSVPIGGGPVTKLANGSFNTPLAMDATTLYVSPYGSIGKLPKVPIDGGTVSPLAIQHDAFWIATDGTSLFWSEFNGNDSTGSLWRMPVGGGTPSSYGTLPGGLNPVATDGVYVYSLYYGGGTGAIVRAPVSGGAISTIVSSPNYTPRDFVIDAANVYFDNDQTIDRVPKGGGAVVTLMSGQHAAGIAVDSLFVYWTANGAVWRTPK